jgi:hypothetical protein
MKNQKKGAGLIDVLKDPIGTVKEAIRSIPSKLNNKSTKTLEQYGRFQIGPEVHILRTPLSSKWTNALNTLSLGAYNKIQGDKPLYHVGVVFFVAGHPILIEKNEVVNVEPLHTSGAVKPNTEKFIIKTTTKTTLDDIINKTLQRMGADAFYSYNAMTRSSESRNNCQDFVKNILQSAGLWSQQAEKFLYQDISHLNKGFEKHNVGFVPDAVKKVTELGSRFSRLIGKGRGKTDEKTKAFIKFVQENGYRFL